MSLFLAILCSSLILAFSPTRWGPLYSYAFSAPFIVLCATSIAKSHGKTAINAAVLSFAIPAAGYFTWQNALLSHDMSYLRTFEGIAHLMRLIQRYADGTGWLMASAGAAGLCLRAWRIGGLLLFAGILSIGCRYGLLHVAKCIDRGYFNDGANALMWLEWVRWIPLLTTLALLFKQSKTNKSFILFTGVLCSWMTLPNSAHFTRQLEIGLAAEAGPTGRMGIGVSVQAAHLNKGAFDEALNKQGTRVLSGKPWHCHDGTRKNWKNMSRAMAAVSLSGDQTLNDLAPHWTELLNRGISRLSLIGHANQQARGPLARHLQYPAVHLFLDPFPKEAHEGSIENGRIRWFKGEPDQAEACVFWINDNESIQSIFTLGLEWSRPNTNCGNRLFMVRGVRPATGKWIPPIPCPTEAESSLAIDPKTE